MLLPQNAIADLRAMLTRHDVSVRDLELAGVAVRAIAAAVESKLQALEGTRVFNLELALAEARNRFRPPKSRLRQAKTTAQSSNTPRVERSAG